MLDFDLSFQTNTGSGMGAVVLIDGGDLVGSYLHSKLMFFPSG